MPFQLFSDVNAFYNATYRILMEHESQNLIMLGNIVMGHEGKDKTEWRDPADRFMAAMSDSSGIRMTALMTPPYNLTLYATGNIIDEAALTCLISGLSEASVSIPGVMADNILAERFADLYAKEKNTGFVINKYQRIYELREVSSEIISTGEIRLSRESDMSFLPYWIEGFNSDCFGSALTVGADAERYRCYISTGRQYVLEADGIPVSLAKIARGIKNVCGIGQVYTPPYFRGKGYATSCVAAVSRLVLSRGFSKCVLYTDLANPTSNSIYQKIGYSPVCDSLDIKFIWRN